MQHKGHHGAVMGTLSIFSITFLEKLFFGHIYLIKCSLLPITLSVLIMHHIELQLCLHYNLVDLTSLEKQYLVKD